MLRRLGAQTILRPTMTTQRSSSSAPKRPAVLVTGGAGYLGRVLVHELLEPHGNTDLVARRVRVLDRVSFAAAARTDHRDYLVGPEDPRVEELQGDIRDQDLLRRACEGVDLVFHCASVVDWGHHPLSYLRDVNLEGTRRVVHACREAGVRALVYTSTEDVIFTGAPIRGGDESLPFPSRHVNGYCETKAAAEQFVLRSNGPGLRTTALRPGGIWGEADPFHVSALLQMAQRGAFVRLGDGASRSLQVYVHNVAHAHVLAGRSLLSAEPTAAGKVYFVTDSPAANFFDYFEPVVRGAGGRVLPRWLSVPRGLAYGLGALMDGAAWALRPVIRLTPQLSRFAVTYTCQDFIFSGKRARQELEYEPIFSEAESYARTTDWFREFGPVKR